MRKSLVFRIASALLATLVLTGASREVDIGDSYLTPAEDPAPPRIAWMKPAFPRKLRVLFIGHRETMREVTEIARRLDMDWKFAPFQAGKYDDILLPGYLRGAQRYYKNDKPGDKEKNLAAMLKSDYDLIVFGEFAFRGLPLQLQYDILEKIKKGTGALRVAQGDYNRYNSFGEAGEYLERAMRKKVTPDKAFLTGFPWRALPAFREFVDFDAFVKANFSVSQFGEGRIVSLTGYGAPQWHLISPGICRYPFTGHDNWHSWWQTWPKEKQEKYREYDAPVTDIKMLDYDYNLAFVIKAMLYAANRVPAIRLTDRGEGEKVRRETLTEIDFELTCDQAMGYLSATFVLRDRDNRIWAEATRNSLSVKPGPFRVEFPIKNIPAGEYFADLWIKTDRETVNFGSKAIRVTGATRFVSFATAADHYPTDQVVTGTARIETQGRAALTLRLRQYDTIGRELVAKAIPVSKNGETPFALPPAPFPLTVYQKIEAELVDENGDIFDRATAWFSYSNLSPLKNKIPFLVWEEPSMSYLSMEKHRRYWENGVDMTTEFFGPDALQYNYYGSGPGANWKRGRGEIAIFNNMSFAPPVHKVTDITCFKKKIFADKNGREPILIERGVRYPSLNDPKFLDGLKKNVIDKIADAYGKLSCALFLVDQEPAFTQNWARGELFPGDTGEVDYGPDGVRYFHQYLKKTYGHIDKLNAEYRSAYKDFDAVPAVFFADAVKDPKLRPLWADFRAAMDSLYADFYRQIESRLKERIPNARTGTCAEINNGWRSLDACDYAKLDALTYSSPYPGVYGRALPDTATGKRWFNMDQNWGDATLRNVHSAREMVWRGFLQGSNMFNIYRGDTGNLLADDLTFYPDVRAMFDAIDEIRGGLGELLLEAGLNKDQAAILYSAPSVHRWLLTQGKISTGKAERNRMYNAVCGWWGVLRDYNICKGFVSYAQLKTDALEKRGYRALVLPFAQALSREEIANIVEFVEKGGTVIADLRPGVSDEHCVDYPSAPLDSVFGVTMGASAPLKSAELTIGDAKKGTFLSDPTLGLAGGVAHGKIGGAPALVVNRYGEGKAILLNFALDEYPVGGSRKLLRSSVASSLTALAGEVFALAGLKGKIDVSPTLSPHLEYSVFGEGAAIYGTMIQELPEPLVDISTGEAPPFAQREVTLDFHRKAYIYGARTGRYYGYRDRLTEYFVPGEARVFALLPYFVKGVSLTAPKTLKQGDALEYAIKVEADTRPVRHVVNVSLVTPDGKKIRYYGGNADCPNGEGSGVIQTALNETPGVYTLIARDAATGVTAKTQVEIARREFR